MQEEDVMVARRTAVAVQRRAFFSKQDVGLLYIAPWFIGFLIFMLYPMIQSLIYCFFDFNFLSSMKYVGLQNFQRVFKHKDFAKSVKATLTFVLFAVPGKLIVALLLAMLLNNKLKMVNVYRTLFYLPSIVGGSVAVGILWRLMFAKQGLINTLLATLGLSGHAWLGDPKTAIYIICLLPMWQVGSSMVTFLAALKQVPDYLYEAAMIDGAGRLRRFFQITLPMISPIVLFNLVMQVISGFQEFATPMIVTAGGPIKTTYLYAMFIYEQAFLELKMGFASALSWVLFAVILVFTALIFCTSAKWTFYEDGGKGV